MDAYDASVGSAWMGPKALLRLVESAAGTLRIAGEHTAEHHEVAHGSPRLRLRLALDDAPLAVFELSRSGPFDVECDLPRGVSEGSILTLGTDRSFVPARIGLGEDARELALRISRIELSGEPILDFARGGDAYVPRRKASNRMLGINVVGYFQSELGIGESARLCAAAAEAARIPLALVDFRVGCSSRSGDARFADRLSGENPHPVNLIHVNADQLPVAFSQLGQAFFEHHYNIGFWHWELPQFPDEWLGSFAPLQEVWVPSRFVMDAVGEKSPLPVVRMPHAVAFDVPADANRERFGLAPRDFLFLTMYDMHSVQERKNPEAVVESFRRAFPDGRGAGLVVKLMNSTSEPGDFERLRERLRGVPGVQLIAETLSRRDVYGLESVCDCFVSLHRSEGFGLGLAESMYLGKPAIGTDWSGNTDFMDETNSCPVRCSLVRLERDFGPYRAGQVWADPDLDHAAWWMRRLVEDVALRRRLGAAGRETIRTRFSPEAVGRRYQNRLALLAKLV
jgi:glycosyltransferase involved in cell wall biosynthesis